MTICLCLLRLSVPLDNHSTPLFPSSSTSHSSSSFSLFPLNPLLTQLTYFRRQLSLLFAASLLLLTPPELSHGRNAVPSLHPLLTHFFPLPFASLRRLLLRLSYEQLCQLC